MRVFLDTWMRQSHVASETGTPHVKDNTADFSPEVHTVVNCVVLAQCVANFM
jgi:hypothetical protein